MRRVPAADEKPLHWVGSAKRDLLSFPAAVKDDMGNALGIAQFGGTAPTAKPWKGLGPGVLEVVELHDGNAYRAVYTVRFEKAMYVLHAFQKKSPSGVRTAKRDVDLVEQRLKQARRDYEEQYGKDTVNRRDRLPAGPETFSRISDIRMLQSGRQSCG